METVNQETNTGRPRPFTILLVLSSVSILLNLLFTLFFLVKGPLTKNQLSKHQLDNAELVKSLRESDFPTLADLYDNIGRIEVYVNYNWFFHHSATLLVLLIGLFGVFRMSRGKIIGFHLYIIYSILTSAIVYISVPFAEVALSELIVGLLFSFLFIWLYSKNLAFLK